MTVKEIRERLEKAKVAIRKSADEYNARLEARKKDPATELWPGETRKHYDEANKEYDEAARALQEAEDTDSINARLNQINEDENRSTRGGKPKPAWTIDCLVRIAPMVTLALKLAKKPQPLPSERSTNATCSGRSLSAKLHRT